MGVIDDEALELGEPVGNTKSEEFPGKKRRIKLDALGLNKVEDAPTLVEPDSEQLSEVEGAGANDEVVGAIVPDVARIDPGIVTTLEDDTVEGSRETVSVNVDETFESV